MNWREMSLTRRFLPLLVVAILMLLAACTGSGLSAGLDKPFTLSPGQSTSIKGEDLSVHFAEVIGDSRCPQGVTCIWAGEVSCRLEITHAGKTDAKVLVEQDSGPVQTDYAAYTISFDVQPYPKAGEKIDKSAYRLQMTFSKKPG